MADQGQRHLSAIMFSDIVGYSRMMGDDERGTLTLLQEHNELLVPIIQRHGGSILKFIGDAILSSYESATEAVQCAVHVQKALSARNKGKAVKLKVRIGIHIGDVMHKNGDVLGDGVNIAARIQPLAEPGGICISQTVYHIVRAQQELHMVNLGPHNLKNIKEAVYIYKVSVDEDDRGPFRIPWRTAFLSLAAVLGLAGAWLVYTRKPFLTLSRIAVKPGEFALVVAPFSGMDKRTDKAGSLIQTLVTRRIEEMAPPASGVRVFNKKMLNAPLNRDKARELGERLGAAAVLWGEVLSLPDKVQIKPYVIAIPASGYSINLSGETLEADERAGPASQREVQAIADLGLLAAAHFHQARDKDRSLALLQKIQQPTPESLLLQGDILSALRRFDDAYGVFERVLKLDPGNARVYSGLGNIYRARQQPQEAVQAYEKAAQLNPSLPAPHHNLGLYYQSTGQYGRALDEFQKLVALAPKSEQARVNLGSLCDLLGRPQEAEEQFRWLMENSRRPEEEAQGNLLYFLALAKAGKTAAARTTIQAYISRADSAQWPFPVAQFYAAKINEPQLLKAIEGDTKELPKRRCQGYYYLGAALALVGKPETLARARIYFERSAATHAQNLLEYARAQFELTPKPNPPRKKFKPYMRGTKRLKTP